MFNNKFFIGLFAFIILLLYPHQILLPQGPPGYILCAEEGDTFHLPARSDVAYGVDGHYAFLYNRIGVIVFNNETFGDPYPGYHKYGYYKLVDVEKAKAKFREALYILRKHLYGDTILTPTEINEQTEIATNNMFSVAEDDTILKEAFDFIDYYEATQGPLFINNKTKNYFPNTPGAEDGYEFERAVFAIQQGIFDNAYTLENIVKFKTILEGKKFLTSNYFPGPVTSIVNSDTTYLVKINASMPTDWGKRTAFSQTNVRRPTGYYLPPGYIGTVIVPETMVNKGFKILVGAHTHDKTNRPYVKRFYRVSQSFDIIDTITQVANPFGGGIYIIVPYQANLGLVDIKLKNVVPSPFYTKKTFAQTSLNEWLNVQRKHGAPWADFETDKFMMQVPTSWIYNYPDPETLMDNWDKCMDAVSELFGYPLIRNNYILYLQVDVDLMYGCYGIGYPQVNNIYNPNDIEDGNKNHWLLHPEPKFPEYNFGEVEFHELGHAHLFSKFEGETEAAVNILAVAIWNKKFNVDIDTAFGMSMDGRIMMNRDNSAISWMVTPNFRAGKPMDISNTTKDEVRYQHRGYGKYIEIAALFGWDVLSKFYYQENIDYMNNIKSDELNETDSRIFRLSKKAGVDLRPLIHFWGVHPKDFEALKDSIEANNLKPSQLIYDRLMHYKSIIPMNNEQFRNYASILYPNGITPGESPDYGEGWFYIWLPQYNESHGDSAVSALQYIIDLYFPNGRPDDSLAYIKQTQTLSDEDLSIYPNPTSDIVEISFSNEKPIEFISIFNTLGKELKRFEADELLYKNTLNFSMKEYPTGLYYCVLVSKGNRIAKPFVLLK